MFTDKVHRQWISLGVETTGSIPVSCPIFWYWHIYSFSSNNKRDKAYICLLSTLNQMPCTMAVANHPSGSRMASKPYDLPSQDQTDLWAGESSHRREDPGAASGQGEVPGRAGWEHALGRLAQPSLLCLTDLSSSRRAAPLPRW